MRNKLMAVLLIGASLFGLNGCATVGAVQNKLGYEWLDAYGGYNLVERDNDLYIEKQDGSESKRITYTPKIKEIKAKFANDGKHILYWDFDPHTREGTSLHSVETGKVLNSDKKDN